MNMKRVMLCVRRLRLSSAGSKIRRIYRMVPGRSYRLDLFLSADETARMVYELGARKLFLVISARMQPKIVRSRICKVGVRLSVIKLLERVSGRGRLLGLVSVFC